MKNLDKYFNKCIEDAYKSEGRIYNKDRVNYFYIVIENQILYKITTPYYRVTNRIKYRIDNNIHKNFSFSTKGNYFIDTILQPNTVCNKFYFMNKPYYLCTINDERIFKNGTVFSGYKYEELIKAYYNSDIDELRAYYYNLSLPNDMDWGDFCNLYFKAFKEYPYDKLNEKIKCKSESVIM